MVSPLRRGKPFSHAPDGSPSFTKLNHGDGVFKIKALERAFWASYPQAIHRRLVFYPQAPAGCRGVWNGSKSVCAMTIARPIASSYIITAPMAERLALPAATMARYFSAMALSPRITVRADMCRALRT